MRITTTIKLSDDLELEVKGFYTPEEPMVWTLPNGDPGYPGSESEFEIEIFEERISNLKGKKEHNLFSFHF